MRERGYGKIINLSSTFSRCIFKGRSVYGGIKAGVSHLTEALALEWAEHGIRVNALAPTAVLTPSRSPHGKGVRIIGYPIRAISSGAARMRKTRERRRKNLRLMTIEVPLNALYVLDKASHSRQRHCRRNTKGG